jgi:hypothetical protein
MITVKIIKEGYGHKPGQVLSLNEFDAGRLMAFGYAENHVAPKVGPVIETQMVAPPEIRIEPIIEKPVDAGGYFKRAYRRKKK